MQFVIFRSQGSLRQYRVLLTIERKKKRNNTRSSKYFSSYRSNQSYEKNARIQKQISFSFKKMKFLLDKDFLLLLCFLTLKLLLLKLILDSKNPNQSICNRQDNCTEIAALPLAFDSPSLFVSCNQQFFWSRVLACDMLSVLSQ